MHVDKSFSASGELEDIREGVRAYFLGEGYEEEEYTDLRIRFNKPSTLKGLIGYRIEDVGADLEVEMAEVEKPDGGRVVRLFLVYDVPTKFRLLSRLDTLYFDLEVEELTRYLDTGSRRSVSSRLDDVRSPVAITAMSNTLLTAALVMAAGLLIRVELHVLVPVALGISLINFVSIVGFADIVVDGMDRLQRLRSR